MSVALFFALSLFISTALVPFFMRHANRLGLIDIPDGVRKVHTEVIPRSGGLAIGLASIIPGIYLTYLFPQLACLIFGATIIIFFGLMDDRMELSYKWKFSGQIFAIIIYFSLTSGLSKLPFIAGIDPPVWIIYSGVFVFLLGATNAVNLSDGLDGLAAGTMLLSLALIAYLAYHVDLQQIAMAAMALVGALLGFLRYNTHPAKVFMGDAGSQFIGFTTAALAIQLTQSSQTALSPILPIMIMGLPILDTLMVMSIRIYHKKSPFSPDKNHVHHQLLKLGFHHYETVAIIYFIQICLISIAYILRYDSDWIILLIYGFISSGFLATLFLLRKNNWQYRKIQDTSFIERRNPLFRRFSWLYESSSYLITTALGSIWLILTMSKHPNDVAISWLAVITLASAFLLNFIFPKFSRSATRIVAYSASALSLYPYWILPEGSAIAEHQINLLVFSLGGMLALSIRITRREDFSLDNQDILVLVLLIAGSVLPIATNSQYDLSTMIIRLAVMLYAIEYLLNNQKTKHFWLYGVGVIALFITALN